MPQPVSPSFERLSIRLSAEAKTRLLDAAAHQSTDLSHFVLQAALAEADRVREQANRLTLSARDTDAVLALLDNPPAPGPRLIAAIRARDGECDDQR